MELNKKAISGVIIWIIGIFLVLLAVGIIWAVASNFIGGQTQKFGSCADVTGKVSFNRDFTCSSPRADWPIVSVTTGDISADALIFTFDDGAGQIKKYEIKQSDEGKTVGGVGMFGEDVDGVGRPFHQPIKYPKRNEGLTYIFNAESIGEASNVKMSVVVNGEDCGVVDNTNLKDCSTKVIKGSKGAFDLGCTIEGFAYTDGGQIESSPVRPYSTEKIYIKVKTEGNPTHAQYVVSNYDGTRIPEEMEVCRVASNYPDWSKFAEKLDSSTNEVYLLCDWKDAINGPEVKNSFDNGDSIISFDTKYGASVFIMHRADSDDEDESSGTIKCEGEIASSSPNAMLLKLL
jgi:hypothetical protein